MDIASTSWRTEPLPKRCFKIKCPGSKYRNLTGHIIDRDIRNVYRNADSSTKLKDIRIYNSKSDTFTHYLSNSMFDYIRNATVGFLNDNKLLITSTAVKDSTYLYIHDFLGPYAVLISKIKLDVNHDPIQVFNTFSNTLLIWSSTTHIEKFYKDNDRKCRYFRLKNRKDSWNFRVTPMLLFIPWKLRIEMDISSVLYDRRTLNSKNLLHPCRSGYVIATCETIVAVRLVEKVIHVDEKYSNFVEQLCYRISRNKAPERLAFYEGTEVREKTVLLPSGERLILTIDSDSYPNFEYNAEVCNKSDLSENGLYLVKNSLNLENVINYFLPKALRNRTDREIWTLMGCCDYEADFLDEIGENVLKISIVTVCEIRVVKNQINGNRSDAEVKNEFHIFSIIAHWNIITGVISVKSIRPVKTVLPHEATNPTKWYPFRNFPERPQIHHDRFEMHVPEVKEGREPVKLYVWENPQNAGKFEISIEDLAPYYQSRERDQINFYAWED